MTVNPNSLANLKDPTHEQAVERGRLGGKGNTTERGSWKKQRWCQKTCVFYNRCPAISTSQGQEKIRGKVPCFIKKQPVEVQNYFIQLFENGEDGLIAVIMDLHFRLMLKTHSAKISARELKDAIEVSLATKKGIYGDKSKVELSGSMGVVIIDNIPRKEIIEIDGKEESD